MSSSVSKIYLNLIAFGVTLCRVLLNWFLTILYSGRKTIVPPINDPILLKSAVKLAAEIREGKVKSEDVIKSYCSRIREVNPYINAICEDRFAEALKEAQEVDKLIASGNKTSAELEDEAPLLGIPFTVKVLIGVKGMVCEAASLLHKDLKAHEDAEVVALMKKAGAICLATTNSPEFGLHFETYNRIHGRTSNPYDTRRTPGGSSGGEGALLGAGASLIGIGNDIAGSIRHPSNFNGIFGHKGTAGIISNDGVFPPLLESVNKLLATGPMCRYAEDLILATKIMAGSRVDKLNLNEKVDFSKLNIYYLLDDGNKLSKKVSKDVKSVIMDAVLYFQSTYGTEVKNAKLSEMKHVPYIYVHEIIASGDNKIGDILLAGKPNLNPNLELLKYIFGYSKLTAGPMLALNIKKLPMIYRDKNIPNARELLARVKEEFESILDGNSVIFMPSFPTTAHYHHELLPLLPSVSYICIFNLLGYPATHCPIKLSNEKLPLGFQIVGSKGQDRLLLNCVQELSKAFGGWVPPSGNKFQMENNNI